VLLLNAQSAAALVPATVALHKLTIRSHEGRLPGGAGPGGRLGELLLKLWSCGMRPRAARADARSVPTRPYTQLVTFISCEKGQASPWQEAISAPPSGFVDCGAATQLLLVAIVAQVIEHHIRWLRWGVTRHNRSLSLCAAVRKQHQALPAETDCRAVWWSRLPLIARMTAQWLTMCSHSSIHINVTQALAQPPQNCLNDIAFGVAGAAYQVGGVLCNPQLSVQSRIGSHIGQRVILCSEKHIQRWLLTLQPAPAACVHCSKCMTMC